MVCLWRVWHRARPVRRARRAALLGAALGVITLQAMAQSAPDTGRLMQDQERLRQPEPMHRVPLPMLDEPAPPALQAADTLRLRVTAFRFSRNTLFSAATLASQLADLIGQELSLADLNDAAARITAYYREKGFFIASAYLAAQDIQDGVVEITILEGRLGKLQLENRSRVADDVLQAYLSHLQPARPLAGDDLERALLLMNGLAGLEVQSTLKPGASVGSTDLDIRIAGQARSSGNVSLDDYGNRYTGAWRAGVQLNVNSPLSLGDSLALRGYASDAHFSYARLAYQLPVGSDGLQLGGAWSSMAYRLGQDFAALQAHGTANIASAYALYPLQRSRISNVNLQLNVDQKRLDDRTDSTQTAAEKTVKLLTMGISGDHGDTLAGGGLTSWSLAYVRGQLRLDAAAQESDAAGHRTDGAYGKWSAMAGRQQSLTAVGPAWSFSGQVSAQLGGKNLDSSEKFALGGVQGVRAYPQGEAACDDAWLANLELRYAWSPAWQLSGFYDAAAGRLNHAAIAADSNNHQSLSGAGLGAAYGQPGGVSLVAVMAWRTTRPATSDRDRMPRLWLNLQKYF